MTHTKKSRAAFTLLELLVVIAIIGVLAGLTATAIFRLKLASQGTRTTETLQKLQSGFDQQVKAVVDQARKEQVPNVTIAWAGGSNLDLARAIHIKLRLRQEFPQTSDDLKFFTTGNAFLDTALKAEYPPRSFFSNNAALVATANTDTNANAALFYLTMSRSRGGSAFDVEQVGSNALGKVTVNGVEFKAFVDAYGQPIIYFRHMPNALNSGFAALDEINLPPYVSANAVNGKRDPFDPTGTLTSWGLNGQLVSWLNGLPCDGNNRGPVIASAGPDRVYNTGDDLFGFRLTGTGKAN